MTNEKHFYMDVLLV